MNFVKKTVLILALVAFIPATSYAIVDFGVYGGYSFAGELDLGDLDRTPGTSGWEYGILGHLNGGIPLLFSVGFGGFWQQTPLTNIGGDEVEATKTAAGFDIIAMSELPIVIHPYVRFGIAIWEEVEVKVDTSSGRLSDTNSEYFKSYYFGFGSAFTVFPMIQIFGEYLYTRSKQANDVEIKGNAIHVGARLSI